MFTKRLKELRKARGLSQGALAKELGLSQQAVGKWETGRSTPDPATLAALASFFKVSGGRMPDSGNWHGARRVWRPCI